MFPSPILRTHWLSAENGGKIRGTNGNCSYGDFGAVSEGVDGSEVATRGGVNNRKLEAQVGRALTDGSAIITLNTQTQVMLIPLAYTVTEQVTVL